MFELLIASWIVIVILAVCLFFAERECAQLRRQQKPFHITREAALSMYRPQEDTHER